MIHLTSSFNNMIRRKIPHVHNSINKPTIPKTTREKELVSPYLEILSVEKLLPQLELYFLGVLKKMCVKIP